MPKNKEIIAPHIQHPHKKWYKTWWKTLIGVLAVLSVIWGLFEGIYFFTEQWHEYKTYQVKVDSLNTGDTAIDTRLSNVEKYISRKRKSYAVGFRVVTETDEDTGKQIKVRKYRGWDGKIYIVHKDEYYSDKYGYDYYFYIDKNGVKIYVG